MTAPTAESTDVLALARHLAPMLNAEGKTSRLSGTLTDDVRNVLLTSGVLNILEPEELGGRGASFADGLRAFAELVRADGPAGWCTMAVATYGANFSSYLTEEAVRELWNGEAPTPRIVGHFFLPGSGRADRTEGGYILNGVGQFASGSMISTHFIFTAREYDNGEPVLTESGDPVVLITLVPGEAVRLAGNWDVSGLEPTDSFDYALDDVFVSEKFTFPMSRYAAPPARGRALRAGILVLGQGVHAAMALGFGQRLLEEIADISLTRRQPSGAPVAENPVFAHEFATCALEWESLTTLFYALVEQAEKDAVEKPDEYDPTAAGVKLGGLTAVLHEAGMRCADLAFRWSGSVAFRSESAVARYFRDMSVARNHANADRAHIAQSAEVLLKQYRASRATLTQ